MTIQGFYTCLAGDTFDMVARVILGDEKYARELMMANLPYCGTAVFTGGEVLKVPEIDRAQENTAYYSETAPWKET